MFWKRVPKIIDSYGKDVFDLRENSIVVNIPFNWINNVGDKVGNKMGDKKFLNSRRKQILEEIRNNPNVTQAQLSQFIGIGLTAIENNIRFLKENRYIERVVSNKTGYWKVKE